VKADGVGHGEDVARSQDHRADEGDGEGCAEQRDDALVDDDEAEAEAGGSLVGSIGR
jgi:hypothetical protein